MENAPTSYLVTATRWDHLSVQAAELCEWYDSADEALDRAEYLNRQLTAGDRRKYNRIKIEIVNH